MKRVFWNNLSSMIFSNWRNSRIAPSNYRVRCRPFIYLTWITAPLRWVVSKRLRSLRMWPTVLRCRWWHNRLESTSLWTLTLRPSARVTPSLRIAQGSSSQITDTHTMAAQRMSHQSVLTQKRTIGEMSRISNGWNRSSPPISSSSTSEVEIHKFDGVWPCVN